MRTLVICDDYWHPASTTRAGLHALGDCGFEFEWLENTKNWSPEYLFEYPLVVFVKSNEISAVDRVNWVNDDVQQAFVS